ncbi:MULTISPECIES: hypothetical protein [unclassified Wolbachia]|uniref:hypothetical protein n=2 Tax=Wolbachia TaxID=953 RepID=UPI0002D24C7C|nr:MULTISPECIES: hypothetical protein [unclassified Wolbachia]AGJ99682.1 hypothetical protein wHa_02020 [Wolbachia endosymbiont of Drosophila simulans wHa]MBH5362670.1 hypothetical protein [Wolbachia endosymbiont of Kradibia gibbosae]MDD9334849.1 hypothetical protein [Rickettsiaceae bacterium]QTP62974.1 hypothetical protein HUB95_02765 [Wolbachia endosymbiont of Ceratosolen solmsi]
MSYEQISICGIILIIAIKIFSFFRKRAYKSLIRKMSLKEREEKIEHNLQVYKENLKIIGVAKPIGKWTKMAILNNELMQRLARLIQEEGDEKGYWELFVKAQASTQGKYKGRGR